MLAAQPRLHLTAAAQRVEVARFSAIQLEQNRVRVSTAAVR